MKTEKLIAILAFLAALGTITKSFTGKAEASTFDALFRKYADDPRLAKAVAMVESGLNPNAMGDNGQAFGLMQIWFPTAQGHGYQGTSWGLLDPEVNIYYATRELNHLTRTYGFEKGIMGYNIGETKLRKGGSNPDYLNKVLNYYRKVVVA